MGLVLLLLFVIGIIVLVMMAKGVVSVGKGGGLLGPMVDKIKDDPDNPLSKKIF